MRGSPAGYRGRDARRFELPNSRTRVVARESPWLGPLALLSALPCPYRRDGGSLCGRGCYAYREGSGPPKQSLPPRLCIAKTAFGALTELGANAWVAESYKGVGTFVKRVRGTDGARC